MKWCIYILCIATILILTLDNQSITKVLLGVKYKVFKKEATKIYENLIKRYKYLSDLNENDQIKTIIEVEKVNEEKKEI